MKSTQDFYHLTKARFSIDPKTDAAFYFDGTPLHEQLMRHLRMQFVEAPGVPRFFIVGQYGAGKTHTLWHMHYVLQNDPRFSQHPTLPTLVTLQSLKGREQWITVHRKLVDAIGQELARKAITGMMTKATPGSDPLDVFRDGQLIPFGESGLQNSQAHIYRNLLFGGRQAALSWEWLKGTSLSVNDSASLGIETQLAEASQMIDALFNLGQLMKGGLDRRIIFLIDEAEVLRSVTHPDSHHQFVHSVRRLVGEENTVLGFIAAYQSEGDMEDAPPILWDESIRRRVGYDAGYIDLKELMINAEDARKFILKALRHLVNQDAAGVTIRSEELDTEPEFFPFTQDAVDRIADYVTEEPERLLPSQIVDKMSKAVATARLRDEDAGVTVPQTIGDDIVEHVLYPNEAVS
jgi:hypothetical protein